jgi:hypothetical protein
MRGLSGVGALISVVGLATAAAVSGPVSATAAATVSPVQQVAAAVNAGVGEHSVRWVSTESANGVKLGIISDVGRAAGSQIITWTEGSSEAVLSVVLVNGTAYLIGNGAGLYIQGFTTAAATKEANKWIAVKPSSAAYASAAAGLTISTALDPLRMAGPVSVVPGATILGVSTRGFKGTSKPFEGQPGAAEKLYLRSSGAPLPVEAVQNNTTTVFDNWGEPIKVTAPLGAIPIQAGWLRSK